MDDSTTGRRPIRIWTVTAVLLTLLWLPVAIWIVPAIIRGAYSGESFSFLSSLLSGRDIHPVERYLDAWRSLAIRLTVLLGVVLAISFVVVRFDRQWQRLMGWLIGGTASLGTGMLLRYGFLAGVAGGLFEAGYLTIREIADPRPAAGYYPELIWMAPLGAALTYMAIALILALIGRTGGTRVGLGRATLVFVFLVVYGLSHSRGITLHIAAKVVLSLGIAVAVTRLLTSRPDASITAIRRSSYAGAALLAVLCGIGIYRLPDLAERRALAGLPAAREGAPNVILIILDTVRAANLSLYGYDRQTTPAIDEWAASGVVFDRAVSTAPWTLPSHASMFTGQYGYVAGTGFQQPLDDRFRTLAEVLGDEGYATAGFVANLAYTSRPSGLHRGFARYEDYPITSGLVLRSSWPLRRIVGTIATLPGVPGWSVPRTAQSISTHFLDWLDGNDGRPFFAFLNFFDAHDPYRSPNRFRGKFGRPAEPGDNLADENQYRTEELGPWINAYDGSIAYIDDQLGRVFRALEARGLRENTLVILTSDHGEMFGEHQLIQHTGALYIPALHVPLAMSFPDVLPEGRRVDRSVSLRDLPATILDVIGAGASSPLPGHSLATLWTGAGEGTVSPALSELDTFDYAAEWKPIHRGDMRSLVDGPLHYILNGDGVEELYEWPSDPREEHDLIDMDARAPVLQRFRHTMDSLRVAPDGR